MNAVNPEIARQLIIPSGVCLDAGADLFLRLDTGQARPGDLEAGQLACATCIQQPICEENRSQIGALLFVANGGNVTETAGTSYFVGGAPEKRFQQPSPDVLPPPLRFDLRELPEDPKLALTFLRRAVRSELLATGPHTPDLVKSVAGRFLNDLSGCDPDLYRQLSHPPHMNNERALRGIQNIITILFQQADFPSIAAGVKGRDRYREDAVDHEQWLEITRLYATDMITLDQRNFKRPERQALAFSPEEYEALVERYFIDKPISKSDFHYTLMRHMYNPEQALREREARLHILRENNPHNSEAELRERARWKLPEGPADQVEVNRKQAPVRPTARELTKVFEDVDRGLEAPTDEGPVYTALVLRKHFGQNPTFAAASALARFTDLPVEKAVERCQEIVSKVNDALEERQASGDTSVPEKFVRHHILVHGPANYDEIKTAHIVSTLKTLIERRASEAELKNHIPRWAFARAVALYERPDDARRAVSSLHELCNVQELVTVSLSEMSVLQDSNFHTELHDICDPRNGRYMTFRPELTGLTPGQRLAIAAHYGLGRLLYGRNIDQAEVAAIVGADDLETYMAETVLPKCRELLEQPARSVMPLLLRRLSDDLGVLADGLDMTPSEFVLPSDITTVIGRHAIQLGPQELGDFGQQDPHLADWLRKTVFARCRPDHAAMAPAVQAALEEHILEVVGNKALGYRIEFGAALREIGDEQELAALAYLRGIDTFMYGCTLGEVLRNRLEIDIEPTATYLLRRAEAARPPEPIQQPEHKETALPTLEWEEGDWTPRLTESEAKPAVLPTLATTPLTDLQEVVAVIEQGTESRPKAVITFEPSVERWLASGVIQARQIEGRASVDAAMSKLKHGLAEGAFAITGDADSGYQLHLTELAKRNNSREVLVRFVKSCGVTRLLGAEDVQYLAPNSHTQEIIQQRLALAMTVISSHSLKGLTKTQAKQMHSVLAAHFGVTKAAATHTPWSRYSLTTAMFNLREKYAAYRRSWERTHRDSPNFHKETYIARAVMGTSGSDASPQALQRVISGLMDMHSSQEVHELSRYYYEEIIKFGRWLAELDR